MARTISIPRHITQAVIDDRLRKRPSAAQAVRLRAIRLALTGNLTAKAIAVRCGITPGQFFNWTRILKTSDGLDALLHRRHGGGRRPRLSRQLQEGLRKRYQQGDRVASIRVWLKGCGVDMTREGIYFWIQKMALRRSRQAAKTQELVRKTISPLQVKMDAATAEKFAEAEKLAALSCSKKMATLLLLRNRGLSAATRRGFNEGLIAKEIAAEASCSRGSLYRWAGEWQRADSNWDRFLESACSNRARKELTKHFDFLKSGAREN